MKNIKYILLALIVFLIPVSVMAESDIDIYLFHSRTCIHCQAEIEYLDSIKDEYNLKLHLYEVSFNDDNMSLMNKVKKNMNITNSSVPFTIIGNVYYIGYSETVEKGILNAVKNYKNTDVASMILNDEDIKGIDYYMGAIGEVSTIFGKFNPAKASLPFISIVLGFIDGFNPCAMWILVFLIGMLLNMKDKKKRWILGSVFLLTSALVYLFFMLAWLNVAISAMSLKYIRLLIALVALIVSFINLGSYFKSRKKEDGCEVVSAKKRKKIFKFIKDILSENSFLFALGGIVLLAVSVNLVELACSAGIPLIFTQILAMNDLSTMQYVIYFGLYILFFMIDDLFVFNVAMITLNATGISTKYTKYSHLIGGIIMLLIGLLMIFKPEWLMLNI